MDLILELLKLDLLVRVVVFRVDLAVSLHILLTGLVDG